MPEKLTRSDLLSLETYHERRSDMRREVMAHKAARKVFVGAHASLYFEDRLTIQYQVQEMLRAERIFQGDAIQEELDAYNPLIPDGDNFKATFMIEYPDVDERREALGRLRGIEDRVWVQAGECGRIYAIADEDLERENEVKTSAVHFLRFQLDAATIAALKSGAPLAFGIDHPEYTHEVAPVPETTRRSLLADLA
ncbi:MAG: DUF3501 family protein [Gammaproteobacteria bacterium]|nr:DUF3501 family protein [Gammaproteobacteria bacterium]